MNLLTRILVPVVVLALAVTALVAFVFGGGHQKTLTADFPRTVSLYEGSDVRVLGVPVGKVDSVTPSGTQVVVLVHFFVFLPCLPVFVVQVWVVESWQLSSSQSDKSIHL